MIARTRVETIGRCLPLESGKFCTLFYSDALLNASLPAQNLIVPWDGIRFDKETFQNEGAAVAAMELRGDAVITVWSVKGAED